MRKYRVHVIDWHSAWQVTTAAQRRYIYASPTGPERSDLERGTNASPARCTFTWHKSTFMASTRRTVATLI